MARLTGTVTINLRNKYIKQLAREAAQDAMLELAEDTQKQAQINVSPGMGPGPHPHVSKHVDTGALRESLQVDMSAEGDKIEAVVATNLKVGRKGWNLGALLELGWHTRQGRFIRYPWLMPALQATVPPWQIRAGRKMRVKLGAD